MTWKTQSMEKSANSIKWKDIDINGDVRVCIHLLFSESVNQLKSSMLNITFFSIFLKIEQRGKVLIAKTSNQVKCIGRILRNSRSRIH
jgi:hypothetical protein